MHVRNLNHVNIQTRDMAGTIVFYERLLGLEARTTRRDPAEQIWLHDPNGQAVIHLNRFGCENTYQREVIPGGTTGAIHHIAFECDGLDGAIARLNEMGLRFERADTPEIQLVQLFVEDPNNVLLELNFRI
ncbi:MAG: VOC family protein [Asticcacaulis sp.]